MRLTSPGLFVFLSAVACGDSGSNGGGGNGAGSPGDTSTGTGAGSEGGGGEGGAGGVAQAGGGTGPVGGEGGTGGAAPDTVRIVAANLSSGKNQNYDLEHGVRILQGIDPDIILIQELNYLDDTEQDIIELVDLICGGGCEYVRGPDANIPNGIISRYPIIDSGSWTDTQVSDRDFVWAQIDVPGDIDLWAVSVHLLGTGAGAREGEANQLMDLFDENVPDGDFLVLGGDFNTDNRQEACLTVFDPLFDITGPYPADQGGLDTTSGNRSKPYDWLLADDQLDPLEAPVVLDTTTFTNGAVIDTRVYEPLSDIAPAQVDDSAAFAMQHMAVIKDFILE
jgi:hypothetical protein